MKSLVPWVCLLIASSQQVLADKDFYAYRLGNYPKAIEALQGKAGQDPVADYCLGRLYLYGYGSLKNTDTAIRYFLLSAEKGYLPAVQFMAKYSLLHDRNPEQAVRWSKEAASKGDVNAQLFMAAAYLFGIGVNKNPDTASHYYIDAARNGNALAQYALAENFLNSRHSENTKLGLIWLSKSAASNNPKALMKLGELSIAGKVVAKDVRKGIELLNQAAALDYVPAMMQLGDMASSQNEYDIALAWYKKAADYQNSEAYLKVAHIYLHDQGSKYDPKTGFLWTLKAAQEGSIIGKKELAALYFKGIGIKEDDSVADEWLVQAARDEKRQHSMSPLTQAALWLSNGRTEQLEKTIYQMDGILSDWSNPIALSDHAYNPEPLLERITRKDIFKSQFDFVKPNDIAINTYFDSLITKNVEFPANEWTYPSYPLNPQIAALEQVNSLIVSKAGLPVPYMYADYYPVEVSQSGDLLDKWTKGWEKQANYASTFSHMYSRAILGDPQAQFEIGQMFQYGIGVTQNEQTANVFYQNAADQQHLGGAYNLGLLYLQHAKAQSDYQTGINWLTEAAFKGNKYAQYVLARVLDQGIKSSDGQYILPPNHEQAMSMLYLSAASDYGLAQYELAEHLSRQSTDGLNSEVKKQKIALVRELYEGAGNNGVAQALLPLAIYDSIDSDPAKQARAFAVASEQANAGVEKAALLLAMFYDRGIGTNSDPVQAMYWYQRAGENPVTDFIIGTYISEGKYLTENSEEGIKKLKRAARDQFSYANFNLAVIKKQKGQDFVPELQRAYHSGNSHAGVVLADTFLANNAKDKDPEKLQLAKDIYSHLAAKGDQYAQLKLAYMFDRGIGITPDPLSAQHWYTLAAEQGNSVSQYLLAQFFQKGEQGDPDYNLAKQWYQKASHHLPKAWVALGFLNETVYDNYEQALNDYQQAATLGDPYGQYNLALMYDFGKGRSVNSSKAKKLLTEAAKKGLGEAMNQLANKYFYGLGSSRNEQLALSWYKKAAQAGDSNALYTLGLLSETGVGTKLDFPNAVKYYQEAGALGNEKGLLALARMYHYGFGVPQNQRESAAIYQKLADRQNAYAQYQLATYYLNGLSGERMPDKGRQLLEQASLNGYKQAQVALQRMNAQAQDNESFVEPVTMNNAPVLTENADRIYLDALNKWNHGQEQLSRMILHKLVIQHPGFTPAKLIYDQLSVKDRIYG